MLISLSIFLLFSCIFFKFFLAFKDFARPNLWKKDIWDLDKDDPDNNGFQNEDLIVWMRTAALPTFRKLYRRVDHSQEGFKDGLPKGNYTLNIDYSKYFRNFVTFCLVKNKK